MAQDRELDIVLFGATGFTGELTAQHLLRRHGVGGELRWVLAGRNRAKLEATRTALSKVAGKETSVPTSELPLIVADGDDDASRSGRANSCHLHDSSCKRTTPCRGSFSGHAPRELVNNLRRNYTKVQSQGSPHRHSIS